MQDLNPIHTFVIGYYQALLCYLGFPADSVVKNLPAKQEAQVGSLDQEDPGEGNSNPLQYFLPEESPWSEEPGGL